MTTPISDKSSFFLGWRADLFDSDGILYPICWEPKKYPHLLAIGETGSGKTNAIKLLLARIGLYNTEAKVFLCDFKADAEDFGACIGCKRYFAYKACTDGLNMLYKAFERRQSSEDTSRSPLFLFFDEWAAYVSLLPKKDAEEAKNKLAALLMLGRSYGVHVVISQQRADSHYFNTARDNFSGILLLGNPSKESSAMFGFDREKLRPALKPGEGNIKLGSVQLPCLIPKISKEERLEEYIKQALDR